MKNEKQKEQNNTYFDECIASYKEHLLVKKLYNKARGGLFSVTRMADRAYVRIGKYNEYFMDKFLRNSKYHLRVKESLKNISDRDYYINWLESYADDLDNCFDNCGTINEETYNSKKMYTNRDLMKFIITHPIFAVRIFIHHMTLKRDEKRDVNYIKGLRTTAQIAKMVFNELEHEECLNLN